MKQNRWNELLGKQYVDPQDSGDLIMEVFELDPDFEDVVFVRPADKQYNRCWWRNGSLLVPLIAAYETTQIAES